MFAFFHEQRYRGEELLRRLQAFPVTVCGTGAWGGNSTGTLARSRVSRFILIDHNRVEERTTCPSRAVSAWGY